MKLALLFTLVPALAYYFRRALTFIITTIVWIALLCFAAFGAEAPTPYRIPEGVTCPSGFLVDVYGERCDPWTREPIVVISEYEPGNGSLQPDTPVIVIQGAPSPSVVSHNYNTFLLGPGVTPYARGMLGTGARGRRR